MSAPRLRSDLQALGGYHSAQVDVEVRLNTNESPFGPPASFVSRLQEAIGELDLNRYPDREALALRSMIAESHRVAPDRIFCANGSNEVLQSLLLAFGGTGRSAMVFEPTYALHSHISRVTGTAVITKSRGSSFSLDPDEVAAAIRHDDPSMVFLCSPNNPTGGLVPNSVVVAALEASSGLVVMDEAYGQFANESALELADHRDADRLVVVRTFSKTWALAGVRLGYLVGAPEVVNACFTVALPYHLSSLTQTAGCLVMAHEVEMLETVALIASERDRLMTALEGMPLEVWPSQANFILFRPLATSGFDLWNALVERSILVRDCTSWPMLENCLRVTVGTPSENDRFINAMREIL